MGSFIQTALAAIAAFIVVGAGLECAFMEDIERNLEEPQPAAAAYIASSDNNSAVQTMPDREKPDRPTPQPGIEAPTSRARTTCTAADLHPADNGHFKATVTGIIDGDTIKVNANGSEITVRLWGIDAPELPQNVGPEAREKLLQLMPINSSTTVYPSEQDIYGRTVATVGTEPYWAHNMTMVASGMAYHVNNYSSKGNFCLSEAQRIASHWRDGIWKERETGGIRPWVYRGNKSPTYGNTQGSD